MGKISNKRIYETVTPTGADYLVGTDAEDLNRTKSFKIQAIADFVSQNVTVGVGSLNGLVGAVTLSAGVGLVLTEDGNDLTLSLSTPDFVESINGLDGVITVQGSTNIGVTDDGTDTITLTALNLAKTNESNTFTNDQTLNRSLSVAGGVFDVDFDTQRVGVNNSTPLYPLDIVGDTSITGTTGDVLTLNSPSEVGENYILFNNSLGNDKGWVGYRGASDVLQLRSLLGSVNIIADTSVTLSYGGVTRLETTGSGVQITGDLTVADVTASSIVITGGTSSDFLKADGSLDSTAYQDITEKGQADGYVPLNGLSKIENTFLPNDLERTTNKGAANGYAPLDSGAKIPLANIPDSVLGQVTYEGTWDVNNNLPLLANPPAADTKGEYYVCSSSGTQFGITFQTGDWIISNGTAWEKVDNTDAVTSVFGRLGNVVANSTDYENFYVDFTSNQSISGIKTFGLDALRIVSGGASNLKTIFRNTPAGVHQDVGSNTLGFNVNNDLYFTKGETIDFNGAVLSYDNTGIRTYTLPDASGTFAFTNVNNNFSVGQTINGDTTINGHFQVPGLIEFNNTTLNTLLGSGAGANMATTGSLRNTAVGYEALYNNTTGDNNTANGYAALRFNTTGGDNTANGYQALRDNTTGYSNTANGSAALFNNTTGYSNTANGYQALFNNTTGYSNTANGSRALYYNTTGDNNTANGYFALLSNTTGEYNTALGYNTGNGITTGSANTIIGAQVTGLPATLSNTVIIADGDGNQRIRVDNSGNVLINKTTGTEKLDVNGNVQATSFIGSGASLTSVNASNITTGTLADARLSSNVALKDVDNNFSADQNINGYLFATQQLYSSRGGEAIQLRGSNARINWNPSNSGIKAYIEYIDDTQLNISAGVGFVNIVGDTTINGNINAGLESSLGQSGGSYDGVGYNVGFTGTTETYNYKRTDTSSFLQFQSGGFQFKGASGGTAGTTISFTERMRIDSSGNVGIGTSSPAAKLEVRGTDAAARFRGSSIQYLDIIATAGGTVELDANNGHLSLAVNSTERMRITSAGNVGIGTSSPSAKIDIRGANELSTFFYAGNDGASGATFARIGNTFPFNQYNFQNGRVGINTASANYPLHVEAQAGGGQIYLTRVNAYARVYMGGVNSTASQLYIDAGGLGGVRLDYNTTSWTSASDLRLKNVSSEITGTLKKLENIQAINFTWKNDAENKNNYGVIAQEVEGEFPELVSESSLDGMKGVKYTEFIPILISAIKELKAEIELLKSQNH